MHTKEGLITSWQVNTPPCTSTSVCRETETSCRLSHSSISSACTPLPYKAGRIIIIKHHNPQNPRGHTGLMQITQPHYSLNHIKPVAFYLVGQRCKSGPFFPENHKDLAEDVSSRGDNPCTLRRGYSIWNLFELFLSFFPGGDCLPFWLCTVHTFQKSLSTQGRPSQSCYKKDFWFQVYLPTTKNATGP